MPSRVRFVPLRSSHATTLWTSGGAAAFGDLAGAGMACDSSEDYTEGLSTDYTDYTD